MSPRHRVSLSVLFAAALLGAAIPRAHSASTQSPLLRTWEDLKKDLARTLKCSWGKGEFEFCTTERYPDTRARRYYRSSDGVPIIYLEPELHDYKPIIGGPGEPNAADIDTAAVQQQNAIEAIAALFPSWPDSRRWLGDAIARSHEEHFQTSIRVNDTSIYIRYGERGVGHSPEYAYIVLTTLMDLNDFKFHQCYDDEQGLAANGCGPDDGFIPKNPRPADNPILHPN